MPSGSVRVMAVSTGKATLAPEKTISFKLALLTPLDVARCSSDLLRGGIRSTLICPQFVE